MSTTAPNPTHSKADGFELVKRARKLIEGVNASTSAASIAQYKAAFARMHAKQLTPEKISNTSRSFYYYRAAWVHHFSAEIRATLNEADKASRRKDNDAWQREIDRLPALIQNLESYRPDPNRENLTKGWVGAWAVEAEKRQRNGTTVKSHSKRVRLRGLPDDWRTQMFSGLLQTSKYRDIVSVLSATGARPAEFKSGIRVQTNGTDTLRFIIRGAKTSGGKYGQEERSFTVKANRPELEYLRSRAIESGGELVVTAEPGALSDKVRQLSGRVFPQLRSAVSAYVFRHQMAADLKASGLADADVSAALGHSVDDTKGAYGAAQSARGAGVVTQVTATRPVKERTRDKVMQLTRVRERQLDR